MADASGAGTAAGIVVGALDAYVLHPPPLPVVVVVTNGAGTADCDAVVAGMVGMVGGSKGTKGRVDGFTCNETACTLPSWMLVDGGAGNDGIGTSEAVSFLVDKLVGSVGMAHSATWAHFRQRSTGKTSRSDHFWRILATWSLSFVAASRNNSNT